MSTQVAPGDTPQDSRKSALRNSNNNSLEGPPIGSPIREPAEKLQKTTQDEDGMEIQATSAPLLGGASALLQQSTQGHGLQLSGSGAALEALTGAASLSAGSDPAGSVSSVAGGGATGAFSASGLGAGIWGRLFRISSRLALCRRGESVPLFGWLARSGRFGFKLK